MWWKRILGVLLTIVTFIGKILLWILLVIFTILKGIVKIVA